MSNREYRDCFNLHDREGSGRITVQMLGQVVRALGANPTNERLAHVSRDIIGGSSFTFEELSKVMAKLGHEPGFSEDDIRDAFRVFDRDGNGFVMAAEIRHVMTNLGEKLTEEEVDEMIRSVDVSQDGAIAYEDWVEKMVSAMKK